MLRNIFGLVLLLTLGILAVVAFGSSRGQSIHSFAETPLILPGTLKKTSQTIPEALPGQALSANDVDRLKLQQDIAEEIKSLGASDGVSLYYKNLRKGYQVVVDADRSWVPASMVKAFVVLEAYRQKKLRLVDFDSRITIKKENVVPTEVELPGYQPLRAGVKATVRELVYAMIGQSDNTAYNTLVDVLDRRNITLTLRNIGLTETVVGEKLNLDDDQYSTDLTVLGRQPNRTSARDFGKLFEILYENKIEDSPEMLAIFKKQKINDLIPQMLPPDLDIAHKTGVWSPYLHDGGLVYKPNDPFILTIFTNRDDPKVLSRLAKVAYYGSRDVLGASTTAGWQGRVWEIIKRGERCCGGELGRRGGESSLASP